MINMVVAKKSLIHRKLGQSGNAAYRKCGNTTDVKLAVMLRNKVLSDASVYTEVSIYTKEQKQFYQCFKDKLHLKIKSNP